MAIKCKSVRGYIAKLSGLCSWATFSALTFREFFAVKMPGGWWPWKWARIRAFISIQLHTRKFCMERQHTREDENMGERALQRKCMQPKLVSGLVCGVEWWPRPRLSGSGSGHQAKNNGRSSRIMALHTYCKWCFVRALWHL